MAKVKTKIMGAPNTPENQKAERHLCAAPPLIVELSHFVLIPLCGIGKESN
jgi:hypothetical protein